MHHFWQEFYQSSSESTDEERLNWWKISKELTWKHQLELLKHHNRESHLEEVKKKASAWFRVTYEPWMTYLKKKQKKSSQTWQSIHPGEESRQERYKEFFSFAWLVYPVLWKILYEKEDTLNKLNQNLKKKKNKTASHRPKTTTNGNP